jgi:hypothetical protein
MQGWVKEPVAKQPGVEKALELGIGAVQLVECLAEDGVGLCEAVKVEELASEEDRSFCLLEAIVDQPVCLLKVFRCRLAVNKRLGGAELEQ